MDARPRPAGWELSQTCLSLKEDMLYNSTLYAFLLIARHPSFKNKGVAATMIHYTLVRMTP